MSAATIAVDRPPVRPVIVRECWLCNGVGISSLDYPDGTCSSQSCGNCAGRGYVATEGGEP